MSLVSLDRDRHLSGPDARLEGAAMRNWSERCPVACRDCGSVYVATPTADGYSGTVGKCDRCGGEAFKSLATAEEDI